MKSLLIPVITLSISTLAWNPLRSTNRFDASSPIEKQMGYKISDKIDELDEMPKQAKSLRYPWLHRSWKLHSGMIAGRYLDSRFNALKTFDSRRRYIQDNPMQKIAQKKLFYADDRNALSPAEKYDLLVGDMNSTLATSMWLHGEQQLRKGPIREWMGLCDGSAGAIAMTPEPVQNIVLRDAIYGKKITFYASDIKALASLLYSEFVVQVPILGGRCDRDQANNLAPGMAPECESLNPALWHRMLLTLVGEKKDVLFMDHTVSREVWNTPIISYKFNYIHPVQGTKTQQLHEALVHTQDFTADTRKSLRHPQTQYIVGVQMELQVAGGTTYALDGAHPSQVIRMVYTYDLEINSNKQIIGGEWYSTLRPDFLWTLPTGYRPQTIADEVIGIQSWDGESISPQWLSTIQSSSAKSQPMTAIVNELIRRSAR